LKSEDYAHLNLYNTPKHEAGTRVILQLNY